MIPDAVGQAKILIVDDNAINIKVLTLILQKYNYHVLTANDGVDGIIAAHEHHPDLIMLDVMMPGLDGFTVCEQLKNDLSTQQIPIIFLTALNQLQDKVKGFALGAADYVTKPFQAEEVVARVENHLNIRRLQKALEEKQQDLERKQQDLERQNQELASKNEELERSHAALVQAQRRVEAVFSVLSEVLPGSVLDNKYRLDKKIGEGGFGTVYKAHQIGLERTVAVKVFRPSDNQWMQATELERFRQEGMSACRIQHPNAVSILDFAISPAGIAYLVMELLEGHTLADEMLGSRALPVKRSLEIILPVCDMLAEAHALGLIHRDIKPDNISTCAAGSTQGVSLN
ncbi:MAG: response regulator [Blastocatellia bacterium]|nr:response regulator [Blastocatellia bacterium]